MQVIYADRFKVDQWLEAKEFMFKQSKLDVYYNTENNMMRFIYDPTFTYGPGFEEIPILYVNAIIDFGVAYREPIRLVKAFAHYIALASDGLDRRLFFSYDRERFMQEIKDFVLANPDYELSTIERTFNGVPDQFVDKDSVKFNIDRPTGMFEFEWYDEKLTPPLDPFKFVILQPNAYTPVPFEISQRWFFGINLDFEMKDYTKDSFKTEETYIKL